MKVRYVRKAAASAESYPTRDGATVTEQILEFLHGNSPHHIWTGWESECGLGVQGKL